MSIKSEHHDLCDAFMAELSYWIALDKVEYIGHWTVFLQQCVMFFSNDQVGSFFMINLCLVVIATQFSETKQREHALMKSEQRARQLHQSASTLASDSQPGSCYEEIIRYLGHLGRKAWRRLGRCITGTRKHFHCMCQKDPGGGATRGGGAGEMNGLANRHSGHVPNDLSHLHQLYHQHHQHHHHHHHQQPPQPQQEPEVRNGGNGFNYPFISPLLSHLDAKARDKKRLVAKETVNRLPQLVLEHGENQGVCVCV